MYEQACAKGLEGIISKRADAPYVTGRQKAWLKVKCSLRQEFIIIGYSGAKSGRPRARSTLSRLRKDGALSYAGKVGTGFSMKSARELAERFDKIAAAEASPDARRDERHGRGRMERGSLGQPGCSAKSLSPNGPADGRIRHPSFQGLREDKDAADVKQEKPMPDRRS